MDATPRLIVKLKRLYRWQYEIPKVVEIDDPRLIQTWDGNYVELKLTSRPIPKDIGKHEIDEKLEINLENLFDSANSLRMNKLLLLGGGGTGKSTMLHYITYQWAEVDLFGDKFDIVFRIQLKYLLNDNWKSDDNVQRHLGANKLACFIYYNLKIQYLSLQKSNKVIPTTERVTITEIVYVASKMKTLLLVDGYNEVSHLAKLDDALDFQDIMNTIYENDYIMMSSRPNALKVNDMEKFDRILEGNSLDFYDVTNYIYNFYIEDKMSGASLMSFLERNYKVRGICEIPINMVLLCLIWADEDIRKVFEENLDINIQLLYREVIFWLGRRYLVNFENWQAENITHSNIFDQKIIQFLQSIAFWSFVEGGHFVNKAIISKHLGTLKLEKIYNFGILKATDELLELSKTNYHFIHLTFQEFFTALCLDSRLRSENGETIKYSCNLIGHHRNEPRYLMVLKFLAGIISNQQFGDGKSEEELVKRTWEAFTCNVDGILEFGLETKITLLMHLLEQSKVNGDFDRRIPNLELIKTVIEDEVLRDISKWQEHLIESSFVSVKIKKHLLSLITNTREFSLDLRTAVEIVIKLVNKMISIEKTIIVCKMIILIKSSDWRLQKLGLQTISYVVDETESEIVEDLIQLINNKYLKECAIGCLLRIVNLIPSFIKVVLTHFGNIITDVNSNNEFRLSSIEFLCRFLHIRLFKNKLKCNFTINFILMFDDGVYWKTHKGWKIYMDFKNRLDWNKPMYLKKRIDWKSKMGSRALPDRERSRHTRKGMGMKENIIYQFKSLLESEWVGIEGDEMIDLLTCIFEISKKNVEVRNCVFKNIISAVKQLSHDVTYSSNFKFLILFKELLEYFMEKFRNFCLADAQHLLEMINCKWSQFESLLMNKLFLKCFKWLQNSKISSYFNNWVAYFILILLQSFKNEDVWDKVCNIFNELINITKSDQLEDDKKIVFVNEIPNYINFIIRQFQSQRIEIIQSQVKVVFDLFGQIIEKPTNSNNLRFATVSAVESLFKYLNANSLLNVHSPLAQSSFEFINNIYTTFCESLKDPHDSVYKDFALVHVVSILQSILPHVTDKFKLVDDTLSFLKDLTSFQNISDYSKSKALTLMADVIELIPLKAKTDFAKEIVDFYLNFPVVKNIVVTSQLLSTALKSAAKLVKHVLPKFQSYFIKELFRLSFIVIHSDKVQWNETSSSKYAAVDCVSEIISISPDAGKHTEAYNFCKLLFSEIKTKTINVKLNRSNILENIKKLVLIMALSDSVHFVALATIPSVREAIIEGLTIKLKSENLQLGFRQIEDIFNIIRLCKGQEDCENHLYSVAIKTLETISDVGVMDEEGLIWISGNVKRMLSIIETKQFLKRLFRNVLNTINDKEALNEARKAFLTKCIEYGLTVTIKRKYQSRCYSYDLVFEDISCSIRDEVDFEHIIRVVLKQNNVLAKQYREFQPLFKNRGTPFGLAVAASDFVIKSLVADDKNDNSYILGCEKWNLSLLHFSDHKKSKPSTVYVLIEERDQFGHYLSFKVGITNGKMWVTPYRRHPTMITTEFRAHIFGEMSYDFEQLKKPRYYFSLAKTLPSEKDQRLINMLKDSKELKSSDILYHYFRNLLDVPWDEYKCQENVKELKKTCLLKLDIFVSEIVRRKSLQIDYCLDKALLNAGQTELRDKIRSLKEQLNTSDGSSQAVKVAIQKRLNSLNEQYAVQEQRVKDITSKMLRMEYEGELTAERISLVEQLQDFRSNQVPQLNEPNVHYYAEGESNSDYCDLC